MVRQIWGLNEYLYKQKKRPGIHSKCRHTNQKNGKYYNRKCKKYKGQGR